MKESDTIELEALVRQLRHCRSLPEIREACGSPEGPEHMVPLLTRILGSDETTLRWKAAVALTELGESAVDGLIRSLSEGDSCTRCGAAWVLGNIGDRRAIPALQEFQADRDSEVQKEVRDALARLREPLPGPVGGVSNAT